MKRCRLSTAMTCGLLMAALILVSGCAKLRSNVVGDSEAVAHTAVRDTEAARAKNHQAILLIQQCDYLPAEQLLQAALTADGDFGPAHNSLGRLYFETKRYYLAAWEFEYAQQLMPEKIEPLNNLGLVYEAVGQFDKAVSYFEEALSLSPDTAQILGNLIRTRLARGDTPFSMKNEIEHLILIDDRQDWVRWARLKLLADGTESQLLREMDEVQSEESSPEYFGPEQWSEPAAAEPVSDIAPLFVPSDSSFDGQLLQPALEPVPAAGSGGRN